MNVFIQIFLNFLLAFVLVLLYYIFFFIRKNKKINMKKLPTELNIFAKTTEIDLEKVNIKRLMWIISIANSIDVAVVYLITCITNILILKLLLAIPCIVFTVYLSYKLISYFYRRKCNV